MFATALAVIRRAASQMAGVRVTYIRGDDQVTVTAIPGRSTFETQNNEGLNEEIHSDDWLIEATELILDGERIEPRHGDVIRKQDRTEFEVMPVGKEPVWRWSDQFNVWMRVHTKQVK